MALLPVNGRPGAFSLRYLLLPKKTYQAQRARETAKCMHMPPRNANWWEGKSIHRLPSKLRAIRIDEMVPFPMRVGACLAHGSAELGARI